MSGFDNPSDRELLEANERSLEQAETYGRYHGLDPVAGFIGFVCSACIEPVLPGPNWVRTEHAASNGRVFAWSYRHRVCPRNAQLELDLSGDMDVA